MNEWIFIIIKPKQCGGSRTFWCGSRSLFSCWCGSGSKKLVARERKKFLHIFNYFFQNLSKLVMCNFSLIMREEGWGLRPSTWGIRCEGWGRREVVWGRRCERSSVKEEGRGVEVSLFLIWIRIHNIFHGSGSGNMMQILWIWIRNTEPKYQYFKISQEVANRKL